VSAHSAPAPAAPSLAGWARDGPERPLSGVITVGIGIAALAAMSGAVYLSAASHHAPNPVGHAVLSVVVCSSFVGAGLLALRRPPYVRFGLLLVAVGFASLLGALHDANNAYLYTIGVLTANLVFAVLVHALLALPGGRLRSRTSRLMVLVAYLNVLVLQAIAVVFDPLTRWNSDHPPNKALIVSHPALATALEELEAAIAIALALAVAFVLFRWARARTPVTRRRLMPILIGGNLGLLLFGIGLALAPLSSSAAVVGIGLGLLSSIALPAAFVAGLLQGRLSRAAVGELLVELRQGTTAPDLQDALRRTLGDPSLELARADGAGRYRDADGRPMTLPGPGEPRMTTPIEHQGEEIGVLVHDKVLRLRPELLDAVNAAAGFALASERSLETVQRMERRNRALLDAIPDLMFRVSREGVTLDIRAEDPSGLVLSVEEQLGRNVRQFLPAGVADAVIACIERALETGAMSSVEYELEIRGEVKIFESRMVPSGPNEVVTIVRDFTEQRRAELEQRRLGEEQAALRRVATLVAGDAPPELVFQTVTEEVCRVLGIREAVLERYEDETRAIIVGRYGNRLGGDFEVGTVIELEDGLAATKVLRTGTPVRVDNYAELPGEVARRVSAIGFRSSIAVPIGVAASPWGALVASLREDEVLPPETEQRMASFAALVALAVASAQAREELEASRLRIVEASDAERRRLERNLHDGAQQRLVALSVGLRLAMEKIRTRPDQAAELLEVAAEELSEALTELRELAQGIHPAVLTERGLEPALEVLTARAPLPVALDVRLRERLPEHVETAAYYVVSEALANVAKHACADEATVRILRSDVSALVEVEDNGEGGAQLDSGSGLRGLLDRVETLDGHLEIDSRRGRGTLVRAALPVR
jgi:signal transduction histidine kinase